MRNQNLFGMFKPFGAIYYDKALKIFIKNVLQVNSQYQLLGKVKRGSNKTYNINTYKLFYNAFIKRNVTTTVTQSSQCQVF